MKTYRYPLKSGIRRSPEFAKKRLAEFAVNVGLKCGHGCTYCSTPSTAVRCHRGFKEIGRSPFETGYAVVDPQTPDRVAADAARIQNRGVVQLSTTTDAWSPESQKLNLGRRCLEAILGQPDWIVRVLTKNAAVAGDFNLIRRHRDRILVGLSLTGTPDRDDMLRLIEPNASPVHERMVALQEAHQLGLRTYGMLCPLLPGIADDPDHINVLIAFCKGIGAEEVFAEGINPRGAGLRLTEEALRVGGFAAEADAVGAIRHRVNRSPYVVRLVQNVQRAMRKQRMIGKLRFLLYGGDLLEQDRAAIKKDGEGVIWLGK